MLAAFFGPRGSLEMMSEVLRESVRIDSIAVSIFVVILVETSRLV